MKNGINTNTTNVWENNDVSTNKITLIITAVTIGCLPNFSADFSTNFWYPLILDKTP